MKIIPISGNGDCLFASCGYLLGVSTEEVRDIVAHNLKHHQDVKVNGEPIYYWLEVGDYDKDYIHKIGQAGYFGDGLCMALISMIYKRTILVFKRDGNKLIQINECFPKYGNPIHLLYSGDHYDALENGY